MPRPFAAVVATLLCSPALHAAFHHVPAQYPTIQAAIDAAVDLDTVVIADGVYSGPGNVDLNFGGRVITVRGANGAANCVIDGSATPGANAFIFDQVPHVFGTIEGLTLRHFVTTPGDEGAIRIELGAPTIRDCVFEFNATGVPGSPTPPGSALYIGANSPSVRDCVFRDNVGSAVYIGPTTIVYLIDCLYERNATWHADGGGAISSDGYPLSFTSTFRDNTAHALIGLGIGGAVAQRGPILDLTAPVFESNCATGPAGGRGMAVHVRGDFVVNGGIVRDHACPGDGGAFCVDATDDPALDGRISGQFEGNDAGAIRIVTTDETSSVKVASVSFCRNDPFNVNGPFVDFGGNSVCCLGDANDSGAVDFNDLIALVSAWGPCPGCVTDLTEDDVVAFDDLVLLLSAWGPCPAW